MAREGPSALSAEGQQLLARRLSGISSHRSGSFRPANRNDLFPLSFEQRRLWFIDQVSPGIVAYNVHAAYRLRGPLKAGALRSALRYVVLRHEVLRARFPVVDGEPRQLIGEPPAHLLAEHDLSGQPDPLAAARTLARNQASVPFRLTDGPLVHAWLARLAEHDHVLGIIVHHAVFDRESLVILAREISAAYTALVIGDEPRLPPLPASYTGYVDWQRHTANSAALVEHRAYWRDRLRGAPMLLALPTDRPRPARPSHRAGQVPVSAPPDVARGLLALAGEHRTTLFTVALAAFQGLLLRYCPGADLVTVGCPVNGRVRVEFEGLIGFFVRTLPIVADVSGGADPPFTALVAAARDARLAAHDHQDVPFDEIVRLVTPVRDLGYNPLFQVWFDLVTAEPGGHGGLSMPGLLTTEFDPELVRTRFDVELHLAYQERGAISGRLLFATDLFDSGTAGDFARHYQNFLTAIAADPAMRLSEVPILAADERNRIVSEWSVAT